LAEYYCGAGGTNIAMIGRQANMTNPCDVMSTTTMTESQVEYEPIFRNCDLTGIRLTAEY